MNETPNYYAIIPANVRYNNSIQQGAKLLYGEITALSNKTGCCWAGDQYFMGLYKVSQATIQRWLTSLEKNGYIDRTVKYKDGSKEIEKRYIRINAYPILKNENTYTQKCEYPILKNEQENNTSINNINTRANGTLDSDFEKLWKLYPNKKGKVVKNETTYRHKCQGGTDINVVDNNTRYNNKERAKCTSASSKKADEEELESNFEKLWKLYPNKKGKVPALRAYKRVMKRGGTTNRDIQNGIVAYARLNAGTDKKYIMHGGTFFNQEAWADYAEDFEQQQQQQVQQQQSQTPMSTFTLKDVAVELYRECDEDYEKIAEEIKEQEIPLSIEDAKRYIEEFNEERDKQ